MLPVCARWRNSQSRPSFCPGSKFPFAKTGPGTLALQTFTDGYTIGDQGLNHASDMLVAYLPQSKILVNADLYSPPPPQGGNLANVGENAERRSYTVESPVPKRPCSAQWRPVV
jgi:hypothetical protein